MPKLQRALVDTDGLEEVIGIQFGTMTMDEITTGSVCEVSLPETYDGMDPTTNGLLDARMGVLDRGSLCPTDKEDYEMSPGYFGHIQLAEPIFFIQYFPYVQKVMRCVCYRCGNILVNKSDPIVLRQIGKKMGKARFRAVYDLSMKVKKCEHNDGCMAIQPTRYQRITQDKMKEKESPLRMAADFPESAVRDTGDSRQQLVTPEMCYRILSNLTDEDISFLGFHPKYARPESFVCRVMPVVPPSVRPSVRQDNNTRAEDDLTHALLQIVKTNNQLRIKLSSDCDDSVIENNRGLLQHNGISYIDNDVPRIPPLQHRSGRNIKSIKERWKGKEGRIRGNIMGKRVDNSARTVISVDPNMNIDQFGVPLIIAMNLTMPVTVTAYNRAFLTELVKNGPAKYPGAKSIQKLREDGHYDIISLQYVDPASVTLEYGDIVDRHLMDGDPALFNRQPSLHRMSMMCHKVKVVKNNTFRLNVFVCKPYNADFDGDEMNMHLPGSIMTATELMKLALVSTQIISPASCTPIMNITQDTLIGAYLLTDENMRLTKEQISNIIMSDSNFNGVFPKADEVRNGVPLWRGSTVYSMILPDVTYRDHKTINIENGKICPFKTDKGVISWGQLMKKNLSTKLLQTIHNMYGRLPAQRFMDSTQYLITRWMIGHSYSIGLEDFLPKREIRSEIIKLVEEGLDKSNEFIRVAEMGEYLPNIDDELRYRTFEQEIKKILADIREKATELLMGSLSNSNSFIQSIRSGSTKATEVNVVQTMGILGQQELYGERVKDGYNSRTLPHFPKDDRSAIARGFIRHSFVEGLDPIEFFFHAMAGRTGTIDTAIKTAESGYVSRKLVKMMEDYRIEYDNTVRAANGGIIQFSYGDDCFDPIKLEQQSFRFIEYNNATMREYYEFSSETDWSSLVYKKTANDISKNLNKPDNKEKMKGELNTLFELRQMLREKIFPTLDIITAVTIFAPFNPERLIYAGNKKFGGGKKSDLTPIKIIDDVNELITRIHNLTPQRNYMLECLIRSYLSSKQVIVYHKMNKASFKYVLDTIYEKVVTGYIQPGEMVGVISAQSLGEYSTQMTLNTFHQAGISDKAVVVTKGVPRLKEILERSKVIKTPSMDVYIKQPDAYNRDRVSQYATEFSYTKVSDIVSMTEIIYDRPGESISESEAFLDTFELFESILGMETIPADMISPWSLRLKFDQESLMNRNIRMAEVQLAIMKRCEDHDSIQVSFSDDNAGSLVLKLRIRDMEEGEENINFLRNLSQQILDMTLRGVKGIMKTVARSMNVVKYLEDGSAINDKVWVVNTDGSNLYEVMKHDAVDTTRTITNHLPEILEIFGVEAVRHKLIEELLDLFSGANINYRHVELLADAMTNKGVLTPTNRHGINKSADRGPMSKASFEEVAETLIQSAVFAEQDNMRGVSASITMGQLFKGGTNFFNVIMDREKIMGIEHTEDFEESKEETKELEEYLETTFSDPIKDSDFEFGMDPSKITRHTVVDLSKPIDIEADEI